MSTSSCSSEWHTRLYALAIFGLIICPAVFCSIADNALGVKGGMKLAEAFADMPNLREVKYALTAHVQTSLP